MMIKGYVYKTAVAGIGLECVFLCRTDDRCQSFNFVIFRHLWEFNDRTDDPFSFPSSSFVTGNTDNKGYN